MVESSWWVIWIFTVKFFSLYCMLESVHKILGKKIKILFPKVKYNIEFNNFKRFLFIVG